MMKDEDWFKFKTLKMSLLVDSEGVAVRMIEGTLFAVLPCFHTKFGKGQQCALRKIQEDPTALYNGLHRQ